LTTKDQGVIFERTTETTPSPQQHPERHHHSNSTDPGSYSWKLLLIKDARVHYVVLKQQPRTTHPTHTTRKGRNMHDRCSQETRNTSPTPHTPRPAPRRDTTKEHEPWSCCLRTQQCAKHYPAVHSGERSRTTTPKGECPYLLPACAARHLFVDIPPMSTRRRTIVCATGFYS
jgi:hypothetical protein